MSKTVTCIDVYGDEHEVPVSELHWRPSVYGIVINDGKILLSKQFGHKYDLPGGGLAKGETPEDGVIREIKEETGIDAVKPKLVASLNSYFRSTHSKEDKSYHCIMLYFVCEFVGGELSTAGFDEDEQNYAEIAEWVELSELKNLEVASTIDYREVVNEYLKELE